MDVPVNQVFKKAVEQLIFQDYAKNKSEIASKMDITPSYLSELTRGKIKLSADHLVNFLNIYVFVDLISFIREKHVLLSYTPADNQGLSIASEPPGDYTPQAKSGVFAEKLRPTEEEKLRPTLRPTDEKCRLCGEKERLIDQQQLTIQVLQESLAIMRTRIDELEAKTRNTS